MDDNFPEVKKRLSSDPVRVPYKVGKPTRQDCNSSPVGTQAMVSQLHEDPELGDTWGPVNHTARAWNKTERESNGIYNRVVSNRDYWVDHSK